MRKIITGLVLLLPAIIFLVTWELLVHKNPRLQFLFGSPLFIWKTALIEIRDPKIWLDIFTTLLEALLGLIAGTVLGTVFGLLLWVDERVARISRPYLTIIGAIPIFAIAPMLIIWFGIGLLSKVIMAAFAVFFVALAQSYDGARYSAKVHSQYAKSLGASRSMMIRKIIIPGALRWVVAGFKISIGLALVGAFIGEFVSSEAGLGHYILTAGSLYDMPRVLFGVMLISLLALSMTSVVWLLERSRPHLFSLD